MVTKTQIALDTNNTRRYVARTGLIGTVIQTFFINKFGLLLLVGAIIYLGGGLDFITGNPVLMVFMGLVVTVIFAIK